ncbi:HAMP domain-containing sensor histidine kinase [Psychrobacillus sp. FSL H8-0484]|uniref:HAMP domain-containing sensor histidine kinase n=1 Tax=Psychrobacillus sp. FSL H8-0484 TaxID=2921390 RepID=UPI0030FAF5AE
MKTLYRQFIVTTIGIMVMSAGIGFLITNEYYHNVTKEQIDATNVTIAEEITDYIEASDNLDLDEYLTTISNIGYKVYIINESGYEQFFGEKYKEKNLSEAAKEMVLEGNNYHGMLEYPKKFFITGFFANELRNTVGLPFKYNGENYGLFLRPDINLLFSGVHTVLAGLIISIALISLIAMVFVAKQLIKPITQLTEATKQISRENFNLLLNINRKDEIGQLARSFNLMTHQLQENDQARKEFISNVSHDFQSPLLNIQGYADLLKSSSISEIQRLSYTTVIEEETKRLSNLTKQLLLLTSLDQSSRTILRNDIALDRQLKEVTAKYMWLIQELNMDIYYNLSPIHYFGNESLLENVWENLLSNAIKYNTENGSIDISLSQTEKDIIIIFQDSGIGVKEDELPHLFERFYRADTSRTKEGTGLGLSIVKDIVELHGGQVQVESKWQEGTTFTVILPVK